MAYSTNNQIEGEVSYNKDIILSVIRLAATEIVGVSSLAESFGLTFKRWFSNNVNNGVKIYYNGNKIGAHIYLNVKFGYNVSDISYRVQENIKNALSSMVDVEIDKINVHILGVDFTNNNNNNNNNTDNNNEQNNNGTN